MIVTADDAKDLADVRNGARIPPPLFGICPMDRQSSYATTALVVPKTRLLDMSKQEVWTSTSDIRVHHSGGTKWWSEAWFDVLVVYWLGRSGGLLVRSWVALRGRLGRTWEVLGHSWWVLVPCRVAPGSLLGGLGSLLGSSWVALGLPFPLWSPRVDRPPFSGTPPFLTLNFSSLFFSFFGVVLAPSWAPFWSLLGTQVDLSWLQNGLQDATFQKKFLFQKSARHCRESAFCDL